MSFFAEDEITSQPDCWQTAVDLLADTAGLMPAAGERVAYVGCGTSWHIAQSIAGVRELHGLGESHAFAASETPLNRHYDRVVVLTRSGDTSDVVELLETLRGQVRTLAFSGAKQMPVHELADDVVDLAFADEAGAMQTRFATSVLAWHRAGFGEDLSEVIEQARSALQERLTEEMVACEQATFLGRGWTVGLAMESALKWREISHGWAEAYPALEYRRGPITVAQPGRLVWMFGSAPQWLAERIAETGATFVAAERDPMADLVVTQRLALGRAMRLGLNPDQQRYVNAPADVVDSAGADVVQEPDDPWENEPAEPETAGGNDIGLPLCATRGEG